MLENFSISSLFLILSEYDIFGKLSSLVAEKNKTKHNAGEDIFAVLPVKLYRDSKGQEVPMHGTPDEKGLVVGIENIFTLVVIPSLNNDTSLFNGNLIAVGSEALAT